MRLVLPAIGIFVGASLLAASLGHDTSVEAGTARSMTVTAMVDAADLIVQGEVVSSTSRLGARGLIETEFVIDVDRTFWGDELDRRMVTLPGGVLEDGRGLLLAGMPRLEAGEEVLLFLSPKSTSGIRMPVGLAQGKFELERIESGAVRLVRDMAGLQLANPATRSVEEAPARGVHAYASVVSEIHAASAARRARVLQGKESQGD